MSCQQNMLFLFCLHTKSTISNAWPVVHSIYQEWIVLMLMSFLHLESVSFGLVVLIWSIRFVSVTARVCCLWTFYHGNVLIGGRDTTKTPWQQQNNGHNEIVCATGFFVVFVTRSLSLSLSYPFLLAWILNITSFVALFMSARPFEIE